MRRLIPIALSISVLACGAQNDGGNKGAGRDSVGGEPSPTQRPLRTGAPFYTLASDDRGWTTSIDVSYHNPGSDTIYVINCNGAVLMKLQKREDGVWRDVWHPEGNDCLSPPIIIKPGDVYKGRVGVRGGEPGNTSFNTFRTAALEGEFRLVWDQLVLHYSPGAGSFGDSLPTDARASNSFTLKRSDARR